MGKSAAPRARDIQDLLRLMAECHELPPRHGPRAQHVLAWLTRHFRAQIGLAGTIEFRDGDPRPHVGQICSIHGTLDARGQRLFDEYFADPHATHDPWWYRTWGAARPRGICFATTRKDAVTDSEWYASPVVVDVKRPARIDSCLGGAVPSGTPGQWFAVSFHRPWGDAEFSARDRNILHIACENMAWLERMRLAELEARSEFDALPARYRKVLAELLAGRSEKQTARDLGLSTHTVHEYVKKLYRHLKVSSRIDLLLKAHAAGLAPIPDGPSFKIARVPPKQGPCHSGDSD